MKGKWWFLFVFIILLLAGAFFIPNMIMYNHLTQDVVEHVMESEGVNESEIVAPYVYKNGFPRVGVYYTYDQDHIYRYSKNQETNEILFMEKREVDRMADYWVVPYLNKMNEH